MKVTGQNAGMLVAEAVEVVYERQSAADRAIELMY